MKMYFALLCNSEAFEHIIKKMHPNLSLVDEHGNTLLHHAALLNQKYEAKLLIEKGIDCFIRNKEGKTAFDTARGPSKKECFERMITAFSDACYHSLEYAQANIKRYVKEGYHLSELKLHFWGTDIRPLLHYAVLHNVVISPYKLCSILLQAGTYVLHLF
jgi:hypothetical protein